MMIENRYNHKKHLFKFFIKNDVAVIGLPLRLTVSLIIASAALLAILTFILNPCLFPEKMIVSIEPIVNKIDIGNTKDFNIFVKVTTSKGRSIVNAQVILKGLNGVSSGYTNKDGEVNIPISATLEDGQNEGYIDINVKCSCFETFSQNSMIKVVRG